MGDFKKAADVWIKSFPLMVSQIRSEENLRQDRWEVKGVCVAVDPHPDADDQFLPQVDLIVSDGFETMTFEMFPSPSIRFSGFGADDLSPKSRKDLTVLGKAFEENGVDVYWQEEE